VTLLAFSCLLPSGESLGESGMLQGLRGDVRESGGKPKKNRSKDDQHCGRDCDDDESILMSAFGPAIEQICFYGVTAPYWMPRAIVDDESFRSGYFARYPYCRNLDGYMAPDSSVVHDSLPWMTDDRYGWLLRARAEYASDLDDMSRIGGQLLLDTSSRWGLDTEAHRWREDVDRDTDDELWTGDCNVVFRFAQSPKLQMRSGLGFNWLADDRDSNFGFNFTYSGDWFPADPWILSAEIDWGTLGEAGLFHGRASIGVQFHRWEVYTGYDYCDVGGTQIHGLVSGLRFWY
jgi:hypothetical protein